MKRFPVKVINLNKSYIINGRLIKKIVSEVLRHCGRRDPAEFEVVFLTDRQIRSLNKKYKNEDRVTDVLSFDLGNFGEIFISINKALRNSKAFKTAFAEELTLYIIHGILHLSGYDDETRRERARMEAKQKEILRNLCKRENLSRVLTPR